MLLRESAASCHSSSRSGGLHGIDPGGAPGGDQTGHDGDGDEGDGQHGENRWIGTTEPGDVGGEDLPASRTWASSPIATPANPWRAPLASTSRRTRAAVAPIAIRTPDLARAELHRDS